MRWNDGDTRAAIKEVRKVNARRDGLVPIVELVRPLRKVNARRDRMMAMPQLLSDCEK